MQRWLEPQPNTWQMLPVSAVSRICGVPGEAGPLSTQVGINILPSRWFQRYLRSTEVATVSMTSLKVPSTHEEYRVILNPDSF